ncbi:transcription antitermination factor NusB [Anoxybacillus kestanbolensis]|uniref:transcription antitermination factor NusB n=1 Tax=Anoxybacillus kestanbolensis TaxID=227476 RepID=UPI003D1CC9E0
MKRHTAREKALQALFQIDVGDIEPHAAIANVVETETDPFMETLVFGVVEHQKEIDDILRQHLEKWTLERVANVDRSILRMAVFEMKYMDDIPLSVSIDEAVELAKVFGDEKSSRFINGVLAKIKETLS